MATCSRWIRLWTGECARACVLTRNRLAHQPTRSWNLSQFEIGRPLGKGKFGRVYLARTKTTSAKLGNQGYVVALKCVYKKELVECKVDLQLRREIEIQINLRYVARARRRSLQPP